MRAAPSVVTRRGLLFLACGSVAGCGFRPLYGGATADGAPISAELGAIWVPPIPDRSGQLMRQALQQRLEGAGSAEAKRYEMVVSFLVAGEGIGIRPDNTTTRIRIIGSASWTLHDLSPQRVVLASGSARALDGLNILNQQYFAADLETETVQRRLAETLAGQIVQQVATYMRRPRAEPAPAPAPT